MMFHGDLGTVFGRVRVEGFEAVVFAGARHGGPKVPGVGFIGLVAFSRRLLAAGS